jgi:hypothetical protein
MGSNPRFFLFIGVTISIYSLLNYYFIRKHKNILTISTLPVIILRLIPVTLILAPVAAIFFSLNEIPLMAAITGFTGYSWLAFLFLFLFLVSHGLAARHFGPMVFSIRFKKNYLMLYKNAEFYYII